MLPWHTLVLDLVGMHHAGSIKSAHRPQRPAEGPINYRLLSTECHSLLKDACNRFFKVCANPKPKVARSEQRQRLVLKTTLQWSFRKKIFPANAFGVQILKILFLKSAFLGQLKKIVFWKKKGILAGNRPGLAMYYYQEQWNEKRTRESLFELINRFFIRVRAMRVSDLYSYILPISMNFNEQHICNSSSLKRR